MVKKIWGKKWVKNKLHILIIAKTEQRRQQEDTKIVLNDGITIT